MAREGITLDQVSAVADTLVGEGLQPTIRAIRERLGTGSPNTIHKHLTTWREARPAPVVKAPELPQSIADAITAEIDRAAAKARGEIEDRLNQALAEAADLSDEGVAIEEERDALLDDINALTRERDTLAGKAAQQADDIAELTQRIEREQQAAELARVELAKAQLKAESQAELVHAKLIDIDKLKADFNSEHEARVSAEQQAAVLAAKLESMSERMQRAEQRAESFEKQVAQSAKELTSARMQVQVQQSALDTASREIDSAKASAKEARAEAKKSAAEAAELRGILNQSKSEKKA